MGFFGDMSAIRKIYKLLELLENDMTTMQKALSGIVSRNLFELASSQSLLHLNELMEIVDKSGPTVQHADFKFCGLNRPIRHHMITIAEYIKELMSKY